jgi:L-threonylcarbamoyladenylate synthase
VKNKMEIIKTNLEKINKSQIDLIVSYLKTGKIVVYPTDTVYGLGCLATDIKAVKKIYAIKKRQRRKPLLILAKNIKMVKDYCFLSKGQENFIKKARLGGKPVSFVLRKKKKLPKELSGGKETIAVRLPDLPKSSFLIKILEEVNAPLVSTSLNISGESILVRLIQLENYFFENNPDLVIDVGALKSKPSTLVDIRNLKDIKILRE